MKYFQVGIGLVGCMVAGFAIGSGTNVLLGGALLVVSSYYNYVYAQGYYEQL